MAVKVSFMQPGYIGDKANLALASCRICETITVPGSTTAVALPGEWVLLVSTEASPVVCANGSTPDAAATAQTSVTTAGYGVPPNLMVPVSVNTGDKINIKAFV